MGRDRQCFLEHPKIEPASVILTFPHARKSRRMFVFGMDDNVELWLRADRPDLF
jgi:hypothetical protein